MKFSVGYQLRSDDIIVEAIKENEPKIGEIYFSWEDLPNGRNTLSEVTMNRYEARKKQELDFKAISQSKVAFNLLLNGNCYGKYAQSRAFFYKIGDTVEYLLSICNLKSVTTTSLLIAKFIKQNFPDIDVRASVNMGIENTVGMDYIAEYFDSFYLKREYNRNFDKLMQARRWCDQNGKKLYGLANSGCLNFCSAHTFHDNLVSHEQEISEMDNSYAFEGQCFVYLKSRQNRENWFKLTNFIRPEDVALYDGYFDGLKIATRMNSNPRRVINAYCKGSFFGAISDLLEPNHSGLFYPQVVENKKIPIDFAKTVLHCNKDCDKCNYCVESLKKCLTALE